MPIRATNSSKDLGVTCFIIYALAQFFEKANADAIVIVRPVQDLVVAGTRRLLPKSCCTSSTGVSGEKPRSSIACAYKNGFIDEPTCLFVFILTWSYLNVLKSTPPTHALISPVTGSIAIKDACITCL